jgi:hypothetical protein
LPRRSSRTLHKRRFDLQDFGELFLGLHRIAIFILFVLVVGFFFGFLFLFIYSSSFSSSRRKKGGRCLTESHRFPAKERKRVTDRAEFREEGWQTHAIR